MYCDLLLARFGVLESAKNLDATIGEPVSSLSFAAPRLSEVLELKVLYDQFRQQFGKTWARDVLENKDHSVNSRVVDNLALDPIPPADVAKRLTAAAKKHGVDWTDPTLDAGPPPGDYDGPSGSRSSGGGGDGKAPFEEPRPPPSEPAVSTDFESLQARFDALKARDG